MDKLTEDCRVADVTIFQKAKPRNYKLMNLTSVVRKLLVGILKSGILSLFGKTKTDL